MSLHKRHTVGRVLRGHAARQHLAMHKRDSHSDHLRMHVPDGYDQKATDNNEDTGSDDNGDDQAVSVVYVTMSQTFAGPAIYSTLGSTPTHGVQQPAATDDSGDGAEASYDAAKSAANQKATPSATSFATVTPNKGSAVTSTLATLAASSGAATVAVGTPIHHEAGSSSTSTSQAIGQESSGLTGGAKAGLAIGILLAIALAAGLIFFCWRRKKQTQHQEEMLNEKHGSFVDAGARRVEAGGSRDSSFMAGGADFNSKRGSNMTEKVPSSLRSTRTASTAPRLSLRPVTQFLPILGENAKSTGNNADAATADQPKSSRERVTSGAEQNPFADASETPARPSSPPQNPFDEPEGQKPRGSSDSTGEAGTAASSKKHSPKSSWEGSEPPTPKSTKFGTAAAVPVGAAGPRDPPPSRGPNNVHRVQLDFKPSMDDELELVSGQLVRMLHEYDDGWALCIRMDRSQQGVAPRTCLSKLPVKPRPQGPPLPGSRPGTAQGPRRPSNPPAPSGSLMNGAAMIPRPLTPTQAPSSQSPPKRSSGSGSLPGGPGKIERKPVPGQAI